jgi:hypothetical protein
LRVLVRLQVPVRRQLGRAAAVRLVPASAQAPVRAALLRSGV